MLALICCRAGERDLRPLRSEGGIPADQMSSYRAIIPRSSSKIRFSRELAQNLLRDGFWVEALCVPWFDQSQTLPSLWDVTESEVARIMSRMLEAGFAVLCAHKEALRSALFGHKLQGHGMIHRA